MTTSFEDILNMPASDVKPPKPLPVGTYHCLIEGVPNMRKVNSKDGGQSDLVEFNAKVIAPGPDVDPSQLAEMEDGVSGRNIRVSFFVTKDSAYRLVNFLHDHLDIEKTNLRQMISEAPGRQLLVTTKHRVVQQGAEMAVYTDVVSTAKP